MRIAVVGAGFVGLTASYRLLQKGHLVDLYDVSKIPGGLASGYLEPGWEWPLERFYHHIFTNDREIIRLAQEVNCPIEFYRPITAVFYKKEVFPFDTPFDLLGFQPLHPVDRVRMGVVLGFLKVTSFWKMLEHFTADDFLHYSLGKSGYQTVWKPLLQAKFGPYYNKVNAAWFWARIKKRTVRLGYFQGGFQGLADQLSKLLYENGVNIFYHSPVENLTQVKNKVKLTSLGKSHEYDKVVVTSTNEVFLRMTADLPDYYSKELAQLNSLDALVCVFEFKKKLMDSVYWLNVLDTKYPFVIVAQHTNMVSLEHYNNHHLVYVGGYFPKHHPLLQDKQTKVLAAAQQQLSDMFPRFSATDIIRERVFIGRSAQPVFPVHFSQNLLGFKTPLPRVYLANLSMVYPWDRGTNYAVKLGENLAKFIISEH